MHRNHKVFALAAIVLSATILLCCCKGKETFFEEGSGMIPYACQGIHAGKTIEIYYHVPAGDIRSMPVWIVMHGMGRNADDYRDHWKTLADRYGFIVLAPHFTDEAFPEAAYQQGNVKDEAGYFNEKSAMTYPLISEVFHFFKEHSASRVKKYDIYGHSAGGQFVHRYLLFNDTPEVERAVAANAGWYTFPTDTIDYPYGIGDSAEKIGTDIAAYYAKRLTILLGDADTLRSGSLRKTPEADAQGLNRFQRGEAFFEFCKADAARRGVPFNWDKAYVPGSGHSDEKMSTGAAEYLYENGL